eukprot:g15918.t1
MSGSRERRSVEPLRPSQLRRLSHQSLRQPKRRYRLPLLAPLLHPTLDWFRVERAQQHRERHARPRRLRSQVQRLELPVVAEALQHHRFRLGSPHRPEGWERQVRLLRVLWDLGWAVFPGVTTGLTGVAGGGASVSFDQNQLNTLLQAFAAGGGAARQACDYKGCVAETVGCHDYCTKHTNFSTAERIENEIAMCYHMVFIPGVAFSASKGLLAGFAPFL